MREQLLQAFRACDRQRGGLNFVSLVDLRRAVSADRAAFDQELRRLRVDGVLTLSQAEGRHGITQAERDAGIREFGELLLFVQERKA